MFFINDSVQNYKLFEWDGDYGHSGFKTPKGTMSQFNRHWYNESFVHYLNNSRNYNEKGLLVSEDWFDKKDELIASFSYNYTEFDSLTRINETNSFLNDHIMTAITYNHKNFKQSELRHFINDSQNFSLRLIDYDESGTKKIKESYYSQEGYHRANFYSYDKEKSKIIIKGHIPSVWSVYDTENYHQKPDSIGTYYTRNIKYLNTSNQVIKELIFLEPEYNSEINLSRTVFYKYDNSSNLIEQKSLYASSDNEFIDSKKYDKENKLIWEKEASGIEKEYFYDEKKKIKKLVIRERNKIVNVTFKYKYDKAGNWIEQTKIINGKERFVWKRDIIYFE